MHACMRMCSEGDDIDVSRRVISFAEVGYEPGVWETFLNSGCGDFSSSPEPPQRYCGDIVHVLALLGSHLGPLRGVPLKAGVYKVFIGFSTGFFH